MKVRFLAPAELEMLEASAYYENRAINLGDNFLAIVQEAVNEISKHPQTWPEKEQGVRRCMIRRFPYFILYVIHNNEIIIVAIMHQKQKPNYWLERL